jgi:hypothetical protein
MIAFLFFEHPCSTVTSMAALDEASYITGAELWVDGGYLAT